jgi:hypothetical protein
MADILYAGCARLVQHLFTRLDTVISTGVAKTPQPHTPSPSDRHPHLDLFRSIKRSLSLPRARSSLWKVMHATGDILFIAMANICDIGRR